MGRPDRTPDEFATTVRADAVQNILGAIPAPDALVGADEHVRQRRVHVPVAALAVWSQLQHVLIIGRIYVADFGWLVLTVVGSMGEGGLDGA